MNSAPKSREGSSAWEKPKERAAQSDGEGDSRNGYNRKSV